jgi:hypothetical protein
MTLLATTRRILTSFCVRVGCDTQTLRPTQAQTTRLNAGNRQRVAPHHEPTATGTARVGGADASGVKQAGSLFRGLLTWVLTGIAAISPAE